MYLKKLELQGFKSFADKTVLEFKPGITAVIGPNGSGKSNISDAIRWVLGEQSIKNLRGSKLEDVIFAGTQARKSVSFAEVSITMDNQDGKLAVDYSEVTITRRIYRSGESEFFINKNACRLKDIVELFMDTGIGRDGYSIIGQGRIDEILSSKSEERRRIFEDAAGIVKYRTRKEEAEKKLENTRQNLLRISDIVTELENQLGPLKEQSEKAKNFLEIRDHLKYLEVGLFIERLEKNNQKLLEISEQFKEVMNQTEYEEEKLAKLQSEKETIRAVIEEILKKIEEWQGHIYEIQKDIEKQKAEMALKKAKMEHNLANVQTYKEEIQEYNAKKESLEKEREERISKKERLSKDKQKFKEELEEKEKTLESLSQNLTTKQKSIEELKAKIMQNIDAKFEKMEILKDLTANLEASNSRVKQIDIEVKDNGLALDKEKMQLEEETKKKREIDKNKNQVENALHESLKIKEEYRMKVTSFEEKIRQVLDAINNKESRYKFLLETENEFEGYHKAVKEVMIHCQKGEAFKNGICGTVANLMKVSSKYETAIEMALGNSIQNIVTKTEESAKEAIEFLKKNNYGRASFLPITAVKGEKIKNNLNGFLGFLGIATDLIEYDKQYEEVFTYLLGKTVVVETMEQAVDMARKNRYGFRIVTLEGDIVNASGQMTGGSVQKKTTSILSRGREIEELKEEVARLNKEHKELLDAYEAYKNEASKAIEQIDSMQNKFQEMSIQEATVSEKISAIDKNMERLNKKNQLLLAEKEGITERKKQAELDVKNIHDSIEKWEAENALMQKEVDDFAAKNQEQQKVFDDLNSDIMDLKISVSSFDESDHSLDEILERILLDRDNCVSSVEKREADIEKMLVENKKLEEEIANIQEQIQNVQNTILFKEEELKEQKEERNRQSAKQMQVEQDVENEFKTLEILHDQETKLEVRKTKIEETIEEIKNKMWEDYETTPNTATNYAKVSQSTAKEVENLKSAIKALGIVNVNAIEEYKAVGERYEFLKGQKDDLEVSVTSLEKIIQDMLEKMKVQFAQNFEIINQNFGEVFVELFGGGRAELSLADKNNLLESGIEIEVQPPGKKLQNMMLLSGGERALTAIALLFAILRLSPSPFCILDEIEAALDDVNVYRYADYLKKFSAHTQFLVITHRKGSMEAASTVYGATMQEHGVTKLVSMKLDEV